MNVLSLFDGVSCGRVALERTGTPVEKYFASEIDKYAIQITQKNYPDVIQLGDVNDFESWELPQIDILIGGSPCQDLSISKKDRKGLDGERSGLFWKYVACLKKFKPKYFLLENVASMPKEAKEVITETLGVEPILINSALVSAQQRKRLYWTNIPAIIQPKDKNILLKDILINDEFKDGVALNFYNNSKIRDKSPTLTQSCGSLTSSATVALVIPVDVKSQGYEIHKPCVDKCQSLLARDLKVGNQVLTGVLEPVRIGKIGKGGQGERIILLRANPYHLVRMVVEEVRKLVYTK